MRRGRGGMSRNSHHSTGSVSSPISTSGSAKPSGSPPIMPAPGWPVSARRTQAAVRQIAADAGVQRQQELARRAVGAVDDEAPAEPVGLAADFGAVARDARDVIGAPGLARGRR